MKILVFEYISGGGFCNTDLPPALAHEGKLMLNALLEDFSLLAAHDIFVMLDPRCVPISLPQHIKIIPVQENDDVFALFKQSLQLCDAAWIIAPETDQILFNFTQQVEESNKLLLSSPTSAIAKTADKLQTFKILAAHHILTLPTQRLDCYDNTFAFPKVIKPIDGVGGENSFFIQNQDEFQQMVQKITAPENYIIQPFIAGDALSISALFNQGTVLTLSINRQHIRLEKQRLKLMACEVNIVLDDKSGFETVLTQIGQAFPDLFGYVGIDLIMSDNCYVVEVNPRLTSSYAGIKKGLGINVADLVLKLHDGMVVVSPNCNQTVFIDIAQEQNHVD